MKYRWPTAAELEYERTMNWDGENYDCEVLCPSCGRKPLDEEPGGISLSDLDLSNEDNQNITRYCDCPHCGAKLMILVVTTISYSTLHIETEPQKRKVRK